MDFLQIVMTPFSWLLTQLYFLFGGNYGLALAVFALLVKIILFPMSVKGKRGMIQMNMISGRQAELQKKYANDKQKLSDELEALYKAEGVDRTGGCLWMMLPMLILLPLYAVVRRPLRYLMGLSQPAIDAVLAALGTLGVSMSAGYPEINAANAFFTVDGALGAARGALTALGETADKLFAMNFSMLGLDLSATPRWDLFAPDFVWNWANVGLFLIPLLSAAAGLLSSLIIQKTNQMGGQEQKNNNMMMMLMGPGMALWFGFIMPAGMGVYWIVNSILSVVQELIAGRMLKEDYAKAAAAKAARAREEKEEEKRLKAERAARLAEEKSKPKAKRPPERKGQGQVAEVSRVGLRTYARGRAYDPNRFGGVTEYRDPNGEVDEDALDAARAKRGLPEVEAEAEFDTDIVTEESAAPEADAALAPGAAEDEAEPKEE